MAYPLSASFLGASLANPALAYPAANAGTLAAAAAGCPVANAALCNPYYAGAVGGAAPLAAAAAYANPLAVGLANPLATPLAFDPLHPLNPVSRAYDPLHPFNLGTATPVSPNTVLDAFGRPYVAVPRVHPWEALHRDYLDSRDYSSRRDRRDDREYSSRRRY
eukprot:gnl/Hemi2/13919_TR4725_c0_g1_i1.p1 gnl/Hemi2/13919_TR4725_c0_g1~~gnl/Hemi2/13919_TR4725_c0_g1_i1.p1  ORF type:complete len:163 (-),score=71.23 gnl/Hemi2/13919_TR4725_c0_g1_i1:186-674(-)